MRSLAVQQAVMEGGAEEGVCAGAGASTAPAPFASATREQLVKLLTDSAKKLKSALRRGDVCEAV